MLPESFAPLQRFVAQWAAPDLAARAAARDTASAAELAEFHAAMAPRIGEVLDHLDTRDLATLDPGDATLLALALAHVHAALAVELQGDAEPAHAELRAHMWIKPCSTAASRAGA